MMLYDAQSNRITMIYEKFDTSLSRVLSFFSFSHFNDTWFSV